jgi:hypothetical protein
MRQQLTVMAWLVVCAVAPLSFAQQSQPLRSDTKSASMIAFESRVFAPTCGFFPMVS